MPDWRAIASSLGKPPTGSPTPVGGGCIHDSYVWGEWFIKTNSADQADNFRAEAEGLEAIRRTKTIRLPEVLGHGATGQSAWLALEALELVSRGDDAVLGEHLAALHSTTADWFGFPSENFIGATPQPNAATHSWVEFFREQRIGHQFRLLRKSGINFPGSDRFLDRLTERLPASPPASLIHGDLWGGNKAFLGDGTPVVFDPAAHHADPECDLAMTALFGGFSPRFYEAYRYHRPAPEDVESLHEIYRLYHILNHALLFGGGYISQARGILARYA
ncbi:fructosamine kinase family protein [Haloferula helveola]|uniref:Fructosamine kinase family protein n=1 Tax=Haloferula helveola TaxID=490095 RepID=A0ABM7RJ90_9BACT|nr:fructosamine kinase family protein [Haloferula helveola]